MFTTNRVSANFARCWRYSNRFLWPFMDNILKKLSGWDSWCWFTKEEIYHNICLMNHSSICGKESSLLWTLATTHGDLECLGGPSPYTHAWWLWGHPALPWRSSCACGFSPESHPTDSMKNSISLTWRDSFLFFIEIQYNIKETKISILGCPEFKISHAVDYIISLHSPSLIFSTFLLRRLCIPSLTIGPTWTFGGMNKFTTSLRQTWPVDCFWPMSELCAEANCVSCHAETLRTFSPWCTTLTGIVLSAWIPK